jgi:hypothetical protein
MASIQSRTGMAQAINRMKAKATRGRKVSSICSGDMKPILRQERAHPRVDVRSLDSRRSLLLLELVGI